MVSSGAAQSVYATFAVAASGLIIGRVPFSTGWKFVLPRVLILGIFTMIALSAGVISGRC